MIKSRSIRHPSAALLLRRLSVGNDHARRRAAHDSRRVVLRHGRGSDAPIANTSA